MVTFHYKDANNKQYVQRTIPAEEFIRRFLQHVLPYRLIKVRYYGLLSSNKRRPLHKAKQLLTVKPPQHEYDQQTSDDQKIMQPMMRKSLVQPRIALRLRFATPNANSYYVIPSF